MALFKIIFILFITLSIFACSASYEELTKSNFNPESEIDKYIFINYKEKADFEAKEMHDWNSAKLYSEKAIKAAKGKKILPQNITYWKIPADKKFEIVKTSNLFLSQ